MFRATVNAGQFANACQRAASGVRRTSTIPILQNALLRWVDGRLMVGASDLDSAIAAYLPGEGEGATTCNAQALAAFAQRLRKDEDVELGGKPGRPLAITQRAARAELPTLPAEDHQVLLDMARSTEWRVSGAVLASALSRVASAALSPTSPDRRHFLQGVLLDLEGECPTLVATDTVRLAAEVMPVAKPAPGPASGRSIIIPREALASIAAIAKSVDVVRVLLSDDGIGIRTDDISFRTKTIDGVYPPWRRVFPASLPTRATLDRAAFADCLSRVAAVGASGLRIEIGAKGALTLTGFDSRTNSAQFDSGSSACDTCDTIETSGPLGRVMAVSLGAMRDALAVLGDAECVEFSMRDHDTACTLRDPAREDGCVQVIGPVLIAVNAEARAA